ncbi:MAG: hypothetical protein ACRDK5_12445 [Solirubrobacterales bacterium]
MAQDDSLADLEVFVGEWSMAASPPGGPPWPGEGRVTFEWMEGGGFLVERWTVEMPEAPNGVALIGTGDSPGSYRQHYFDSRGVHRVYEMSLEGGTWKLWRDEPDFFPQRFTGTISEEGKTIAGRWEIAEDRENFETDFDLTYTRIE